MTYATSLVSTRAFRGPGVTAYLHKQFTHSLGGEPKYEWRFIRRGDVLYTYEDKEVPAPEDMAEIVALG